MSLSTSPVDVSGVGQVACDDVDCAARFGGGDGLCGCLKGSIGAPGDKEAACAGSGECAGESGADAGARPGDEATFAVEGAVWFSHGRCRGC